MTNKEECLEHQEYQEHLEHQQQGTEAVQWVEVEQLM